MQSSAIMAPKWAQGVTDAILAAAIEQVGIERIEHSVQTVSRRGSLQVDRVQIILTVKAP